MATSIYAITENTNDVAMLLIDESDRVHINEEARASLKKLWPNASRKNLQRLIPDMARELDGGYLYVAGVKVSDECKLVIIKPEWRCICNGQMSDKTYPNEWLIIEALEAETTPARQRDLKRIAVIERCLDSGGALRSYRRLHQEYPLREFYFVHTSREVLDIREQSCYTHVGSS